MFNPENNRYERPTQKKKRKKKDDASSAVNSMSRVMELEEVRMSEEIDEGQKLLVFGIGLHLIN